jgi:hypothetical protein
MRNAGGTPEPSAAEQIQTIGGEYHRFESTYRPRVKTLSAPRSQEKCRPRRKTPRKPTT